MHTALKIGKRQIVMIAAAALGALFALVSPELPPFEYFAGGYAHAFPAVFTMQAIANAVLLQALPPALLYFAGFTFICRYIVILPTAVRCLFSGYILTAMPRVRQFGAAYDWILFVLIFLFEVFSVLIMNSMGRLAECFSKACAQKVKKKTVIRYTKDQLFFCGLVFLLYLMRGAVVLLLKN